MFHKWILCEPLYGEILVLVMELEFIPPANLPDPAVCRRAKERARTRIRIETRHLAFLDQLAAQVRRENHGRLSRAELLTILVRVLIAADLDIGRIGSERDLADRLRERSRAIRARAAGESVDGGERFDVMGSPQHPTEAVTFRIPLDELVRLDLLLAEIRFQVGAFVGRSGAVRALVDWLEEMNVGVAAIRSGADLERRLTRLVSGAPEEPIDVAIARARSHSSREGEASS